MSDNETLYRAEQIRVFNRFYTQKIGVLHEKLLESPYPLTEARVIYEIAHHEKTTASDLCTELRLDPGYLSRILSKFNKKGIVSKTPSEIDGRQNIIQLTEKGLEAFSKLNTSSRQEITAMLNELQLGEQVRLLKAMKTIEDILGAEPEHKTPYLLRPPQPGDMGWVVYRHGELYSQEYGWDETFEALVAEIVAHFINDFNQDFEHCWIAERDGENVGSVFIVRKSDKVAKLRLLIVEPKARGLGIGTRLVDECIRFSRQRGYEKIELWTNSVLTSARHIYERAGFELVKEEPHRSFGHDLIGETWELDL